ncbi:hypothetical protein LTR56_024135 [Elasticomyces elasticus]|nr:hypothetical protein LTR56_024135 [Elasticomyces elasticus]KAK3622028.1 hypothetical protein LTR22_024970 [Elasticomyces elasticus]KAK4908033.1 hypothetical protein LTR49_023022 [Elasticomyces elasticus]KAK5731598.1 hypothetical protein LTS12_027244 [Elasticomyces elasticus]
MLKDVPKARYLDQGGIRVLAELLHHHYGNRIVCATCPTPPAPVRAYCKDEGKNGSESGEKRRFFRCRNSVKRRRETGASCLTHSCMNYVMKRIGLLGEDRVNCLRKEVLEKLTAQDEDTSGIDTKIHPPVPFEVNVTEGVAIKTEPKEDLPKLDGPKPKRPVSITPLKKQDHGPPGKYAHQYSLKRPRPNPPAPVERQIQGLSKQIEMLAENLVEIQELLVKPSRVDDIVLDYNPQDRRGTTMRRDQTRHFVTHLEWYTGMTGSRRAQRLRRRAAQASCLPECQGSGDEAPRAPQTVAYTPRPKDKTGARHTGGMYLLASDVARSQMAQSPTVTDACIQMAMGGSTIAGVYLQPTMSGREVEDILQQLASADVVLGDINVRYTETTGIGTPKDRALVFSDWAQHHAFVRLEVSTRLKPLSGLGLSLKLTLDHCFVNRNHVASQLHLLTNSSVGALTDHDYTLVLSLEPPRHSNTKANLPRFRIGRLSDEKTRENMVEAWHRIAVNEDSMFDSSSGRDVDSLNDYLVRTCQILCHKVLGTATATGKRSKSKTKVSDQSYFQMMRQVFSLDEQNGPLFSTTPASTGLDEAAEVLCARYTPPVPCPPIPAHWVLTGDETLPLFMMEETGQAIVDQDASKACGSDGVHIKVLKCLLDTPLITFLTSLYNTCLYRRGVPLAWGRNDI